MAKRNSRYKKMEFYMTLALLADGVIFILYLISAGADVLWARIVTAVFAIILSILCLSYLYLTKELLRQRSLWMSASAAIVLLCVIFSLILNFPSPKPLMPEPEVPSSLHAYTQQ